MTAKPTAIDDKGGESTITISATDETGKAGTGTVALTTAAGSLDTMMVTLANGTGTAKFTCAIASDPGCKGSVHISGTWTTAKKVAVTGFTNIQVGTNGGGAGGGGGTDGGTDGGSTGGGAGGGGGNGGGGGTGGGGTSAGDGGLTLTAARTQLYLGVGDSTIVTATTTAGGAPAAGQTVNLTVDIGALSDPDGGTPGPTFSGVTSSTGELKVKFSDTGTAGTGSITATNPGNGDTATLPVKIATVQSITYVDTTCAGTPCTVMGIKNSGYNESAQVIFKAVDSLGTPVVGLNVTFTLNTPPSMTTVSPSTTTDSNGLAIANVSSGPVIGSFSVTATVAPGISATSDTIGVRAARPANQGFTVQCNRLNIAAFASANPPLSITVPCTITLVDRNNNHIGTGTAVNLLTEAGRVPAQVPTQIFTPNGANEGIGTFDFDTVGAYPPIDVVPLAANAGIGLSAEPSWVENKGLLADGGANLVTHNPRDGLVTIIAYLQGEEWFSDSNNNGVYDLGETFLDQGEPLVDSNDNGVWDQGENFVDSIPNGVWDGPNGQWDGSSTIWTEVEILYTDLVSPALSVFVPSSYGSCAGGNGIDKGTSQGFSIYAPDENYNQLESSTNFAIAHSATKGTIQWFNNTAPVFVDNYGFPMSRDKIDPSSGAACASTSNSCIWQRHFSTWTKGLLPNGAVINGADVNDMTACQNDAMTVTITNRQVTSAIGITGAIK
ncbi:MAG: hypothetical protein QM723_30505 [Myxococcaceae bacterium]